MQWVAIYNDGSVLRQYNADGTERKYVDIDRSRLRTFALMKDDGEQPVFAMHFEPGQRLIFRRRVEQRTSGDKYVIYMVGWQQTIDGQNIQSIAYVFPDGMVHVAGQWKNDHPWFYAVELLPHEQ